MQNSLGKTLSAQGDIMLLVQEAEKLARDLGFGQRSSQKALKEMAHKELERVPVLLGDDCECWN